jgi:hypothetical protein
VRAIGLLASLGDWLRGPIPAWLRANLHNVPARASQAISIWKSQ